MLKRLAVAVSLSILGGVAAQAQDFRSPAPAGAKVYFIEPKDGAEVSGPIIVKVHLQNYIL